MANAQATATAPSPAELIRKRQTTPMPGEDLTIAQSMRVMDVAREMRDQRQSAEEMFRRDDARAALRDKLMRTAQLSGDKVTEAEVDAAIEIYFANLHTYEPPKAGIKTFLASCWIYRTHLMIGAGTLIATAGLWLTFF